MFLSGIKTHFLVAFTTVNFQLTGTTISRNYITWDFSVPSSRIVMQIKENRISLKSYLLSSWYLLVFLVLEDWSPLFHWKMFFPFWVGQFCKRKDKIYLKNTICCLCVYYPAIWLKKKKDVGLYMHTYYLYVLRLFLDIKKTKV